MHDLTVSVIARDAEAADLLLGLAPAGARTRVLVPGPEPAVALAADEIVLLPCELDQPDVAAPVIASLIAGSDLVLLDSAQPSRDLAGWLCAILDAPLVWAIDALRPAGHVIEADRIVGGGAYRLVHQLEEGTTTVVLGRPTQAASQQGRTAATAPARSTVDTPVAEPRVRTHAAEDHGVGGVPLAAARTIVSVGRGIGGPERVDTYRRLAARAGAALGASRVAVDAGWVPFAHQVGQTGTAVAPDLYVAFGISGAVQHLAGMRSSRTVVAVNTDPDAPITQLADIVVVADANEVADAVLARLDAMVGDAMGGVKA